jgi:ubiquinone biosynthesis protein
VSERPDLADELRQRGPLFVRLGHYLSQRPDVVADDDRAALRALGDQLPPSPWSALAEPIRRTLGRQPDTVFAAVDPAPIQSNAISQTHRARLRDGAPVLVKVVRPAARDDVAAATAQPAALAALIVAHAAIEPADDVEDVVEEALRWLARQLDLTTELGNVERLRRLAVNSAWERIPIAHPELCSAEVLVIEDVGGVPMGDILRTASSRRLTAARHVGETGTDPARLARVIATVALRQAFRYRFFQVDLHPGNLLALPGDLLSFVDYSWFGRIDRSMAEQQVAYLSGVVEEDLERSLEPPTDVVSLGDQPNLAVFRRDLLRMQRDREMAAADRGMESDPWPSQSAELLIDVMRAARLNGVPLPDGARLMYRSIVGAGESARGVHDTVDLQRVMQRFLGVARLDSKIRSAEPDRIEETAISVLSLLRDAPGQVQRILADLADGTFTLNVWSSEVPAVERNRDRRARIVVASTVSISLAMLLTISSPPAVLGVSVAWLVGAALVCVYAWTLIAWWRLR